MPDSSKSNTPDRPIPCPACRYDLRGTEADVCPECGRPRIWRLVDYTEPADYVAACAALRQARIPFEEYRHFGGLEGATMIVGGRDERFTIGLGLPQIEPAARTLEEAGLPLPLIIIERANPFCDVCNTNLSAVNSGVCPRCASEFAWDDELDFEEGADPETTENDLRIVTHSPVSKSSPLLLGLDVGTSGCKAVIIDTASGAVLAGATSEYPLSTPHPLWAEQNPQDWWNASCIAIRKVLADSHIDLTRLKGLGLTGQMHGLVLLDKTGRVLRPAILWNDQRTGVSGGECEAITRLLTQKRLIELTGNVILPGFTAPKILWVRQHEPEIYAQIAHILLPKDYVRFRLTGAHAIDVADASGTSLLNVAQRQWSDEMLSALDITHSWLPKLHESADIASTVSADGARATGLPARLPVAAGAGDQAAQAVGTGIVAQGSVSVTIGTSGVVFAACDSYRFEPEGRLHAFCHAQRGGWHLMGVMLSAGGSLRWYRDTLCAEEITEAKKRGVDPYELIMAQAAQSPPGAKGLIFLPYLTGERTPHPDPHARGAFIGLTLQHTKSDLARSVIEGVTFGLRDCLDLLTDAGVVVREVRASGGGARSALWRQILADVFDVPILTVNSTEGAAYGAALLAGVGTGVWGGVAQAAESCIRITGRTEPDFRTAAIYRECHALYRSLYPKLESAFPALGRCGSLTSAP